MLVAALLRLYPVRWRARYGDEFESILLERTLGPFDVLDVALGALDAHLHLRGLGAASEHRKGFTMSLRTGGLAAILGSLVWLAGFLANFFDGSDDAWPTSGIILAGALLLIVGIAGLSAFAARKDPALAWAAFLTPAIGTAFMAVGLIGMGVLPDTGGFNAWGLGMLGLVTLMVGSGLFAVVSWRTGPLSRFGTALLIAAGVLAIPSTIVLIGLVPWEPLAPAILISMLVAFTGGWLLEGIAAVRADRPLATATGAAA
jgi:LPXTG-motif cell wall-anchored protein